MDVVAWTPLAGLVAPHTGRELDRARVAQDGAELDEPLIGGVDLHARQGGPQLVIDLGQAGGTL